jgi:hypothetical protein
MNSNNVKEKLTNMDELLKPTYIKQLHMQCAKAITDGIRYCPNKPCS